MCRRAGHRRGSGHGRGRGSNPVPEATAATAVTEKPAARMPTWPPVLGADYANPLVVDHAKRTFGGVTAVDDVDLTITRGQIHGLIGSNGSGKTTLLNLISGFYSLNAGQIRIGSTRLDDQPSHAVARAGVARTFQSPKLMLRETALENVIPAVELRVRCSGANPSCGCRAECAPTGRRATEALEILEALGLQHVIPAGRRPPARHPATVEVARAIALRPSFILLDEPAAGLSPVELELVAEVCQNLARSGVGVLLIEHNVPMVLSIADTVTACIKANACSRAPRLSCARTHPSRACSLASMSHWRHRHAHRRTLARF